MNFKVEVTCECGCKYQIASGKHPEGKRFACPSCGLEIPESVASDLRVGLECLGNVPVSMPDKDGFDLPFGGFGFRIIEPKIPF